MSFAETSTLMEAIEKRIAEEILDCEKAVAVALRMEFPALQSSTDEWRPIARRACEVIAGRVTVWGDDE